MCARWLPTTGSNVPRTGRCRRPAAEEGRGAGKDLLRRLPRRRRTPPSDSRVVGGYISWRRRRSGARGGVGRERGTSGILDSPASLPRKRERGREGGTGKVKPGEHCWKNKAGLWKADTDTQAQEQERKRRRHSGPQQEKTKLNLGRDHDKVQRQQTQLCGGGWGNCT